MSKDYEREYWLNDDDRNTEGHMQSSLKSTFGRGQNGGSGNLKINMRQQEGNLSASGGGVHSGLKGSDKKKKKKHKALKIILIILLAVILLLLIAFGVVLLAFPAPSQTVFLIAGTDEGGTRTDTIMLGVMNVDKEIDITLVSIPRDTYITVSDANYKKMCESYPQPGSQSMKINSVHHFAGEGQGMQMLVDEVERNFHVDIDYYAKVDFEAFGYLVDSLGGVKFNVPMDMDYEDPYQDLYIHLKAGEQVLDGEKAEQLMRFRAGYAMQDLERVKVQQEFTKTLITEAVKPKNILKNWGAYSKLCKEYMDTNFKMGDAINYVRCVFMFGGAQLNTGTVPGTTASRGGQAVYIADFEEFVKVYGEKYQ